MKIWKCSLPLVLGLFPALPAAFAQAPATPATPATPAAAGAAPAKPVIVVDPKVEAEADALFTQGEARMKVASYEDAITVFRNVLKRYPDTQTRFKAQFRMADALVAQKKEADALKLLEGVVQEESPEWSPKALLQIGDTYASQQKYGDAFRSYRQIIADYGDSPVVDRANYSIGVTHFRLGHFELAAQELEKVGTSYAARISDLQRISPGEPLHIRLIEPNTVAKANSRITVTVNTSSGDQESAELLPDVEGGENFHAALKTELNAAKPGDRVLQLYGSDTVSLRYRTTYVGGGGAEKTVTMPVASSARLIIRDSAGNEVRGVVISDTMTIEVNDADCDTSGGPDTITVAVKTRKKDDEQVTLTETGAHTGIFRAALLTAKGAPNPGSNAIETNADFAEGSATQFDDLITVVYSDQKNLNPGIPGPRNVTMTATMFAPTPGSVEPVEANVTRADLDIKSLLYKGRSLSEIAATYRDLGQDNKAGVNFRKAIEQFQIIVNKYPNAPEVEDALYGLFQNYVGQDQYDAAIAVISQITRRFPQSSRAPQALFELASLHVKREEYDRALAIYQNLLSRTRGTPLAEESNYAIVTTYILMAKPQPGSLEKPPVTREQVTVSLEDFVRNFPNSDRAPEALWQLVDYQYKGEDYRGAIDTARRMMALFPDNVMTGRVLLLQGQAYIKLKQTDDAMDTFRVIIANYGGESDQAAKLLAALEKRSSTASGSTGGSTGSTGGATKAPATGGGTGGATKAPATGGASGGAAKTPAKTGN